MKRLLPLLCLPMVAFASEKGDLPAESLDDVQKRMDAAYTADAQREKPPGRRPKEFIEEIRLGHFEGYLISDKTDVLDRDRLRACQKWPCVLFFSESGDHPADACGELWEKTKFDPNMVVRCKPIGIGTFLVTASPTGAASETVTIRVGNFKKSFRVQD